MSIDLADLERRVHRTYWNDGLLDLFVGLAVTTIGLSWIAEAVVVGAVVPAVLVPLWGPARAQFTEPRMGRVELGEPRQRRQHALLRLLLIAGVMSFLLGLGAFALAELGLGLVLVKAAPSLVVGVAGIAVAEALELRRFFVYGGLLIAGAVTVGLLPLNPGWGFVPGGVAALVWGLTLAIRLARQSTRDDGEDVDA